MREEREELLGMTWVAVGGVLTVVLPLWILLTAVVVQLTPELAGLTPVIDSSGPELAPERITFGDWVQGAKRAGLFLLLALPFVGGLVGGGWLVGHGIGRRQAHERDDLDAQVRDSAVLEGVQLAVRTSATSPAAAGSATLATEEEESTAEATGADPGRRLAAAGIDAALLAIACAPALAVAGRRLLLLLVLLATWVFDSEGAGATDWGTALPADEQLSFGISVAASTVAILVLASVQFIGLARHGQTLGKRWVGIRVVRVDGRPSGFLRSFGLRIWVFALLCAVVPIIGWLIVPLVELALLFSLDRRTLHDRLANTIVVDA